MERYTGQIFNEFDIREVDPADPLGFTDKNIAPQTTTVTIRETNGTLATIYNLNDPIVENEIANPINIDANGTFSFYAANGRYNIVVNEGEDSEYTIGDQIIYDAIEANVPSNIQDQIDGLTSDISDFSDTLDNFNDDIGIINGDITTINQTLGNIRDEIEDVVAPDLERLDQLSNDFFTLNQSINNILIARAEDNILSTRIEREQIVIVEDIKREIIRIDSIGVGLEDAQAEIIRVEGVVTTNAESTATSFTNVGTRFDANEANITTLQETQTSQGESIATLFVDVSSNTQGIEDVEGSVTTLQQALTTESQARASDITRVETSIGDLSSEVTTLNTSFTDFETETTTAISSITTSISGLEDFETSASLTITSYGDRLDDIEASDITFETRVGDLETFETSASASISSINDSITGIQGSLTSLDTRATDLESFETSATLTLSSLNDSVTGLNGSVATLGTRATDLETFETNAGLTFTSINGSITNINGDIDDINDDIDDIESDISTINGSLITLGTDISNAQGDATSALTLASGVDTQLDELRGFAQLSVDANGNVSFLQLDATPTVTRVKFKTDEAVWVNQSDEEVIFFDLNLGSYVFDGQGRFTNGLVGDFNDVYIECGINRSNTAIQAVDLGYSAPGIVNNIRIDATGININATQTDRIWISGETRFYDDVEIRGILTVTQSVNGTGKVILSTPETNWFNVRGNCHVNNNLDVGGSISSFTGSHHCYVKDNFNAKLGDILVRKSIRSKSISQTVFNADICEEEGHTNVLGVLSRVDEENSNIVYCNALGEGLINVKGFIGTLKYGDYLKSSHITGKVTKQEDNIHRTYTVAKFTGIAPVKLNSEDEEKSIPCVYLCG